MALSSQGCEAPGDMSAPVPRPWPGRAIRLPQLAAACGKGPGGSGEHLSLSLSLSWLFQFITALGWGEGPRLEALAPSQTLSTTTLPR